MSNQHTPAPWSIEWDHQSNTPEFIRAFVDGEMEDVAILVPDAPVANAHLIAAAPDLLDALKASMKKLEEMAESISLVKSHLPITHTHQNILAYDFTQEWEQAERAIAKATNN